MFLGMPTLVFSQLFLKPEGVFLALERREGVEALPRRPGPVAEPAAAPQAVGQVRQGDGG
jgi:hypothetical protein